MAGENPMDPYLDSSVGAEWRGPITTMQPNGKILRRPQHTKFFTYLNHFEPLVFAGQQVAIDSFNIDGDADFCIYKQAALAFDVATGAPKRDDVVLFQVSPTSESFNFQPVFLANLGSGRFPKPLSPPIRLPRNAIWSALATPRNLAGTDTTIFIAHHGAKVYRQPFLGPRLYHQQKFFSYPVSFTATDGGFGTIPAGQTLPGVIRLDGDSDFDVRHLTVVSDGPITLQIRTDDDNWFQRPIRSELLGGSGIAVAGGLGAFSGELPFWLPAPRLITKAGYINCTVTNQDLVNAIRCQIVAHGARLYPGGGIR